MADDRPDERVSRLHPCHAERLERGGRNGRRAEYPVGDAGDGGDVFPGYEAVTALGGDATWLHDAPRPSGEERLMLAVLEEALDNFRTNLHATTRAEQLLFFKVEQWFGSDETAWPFSFVNICEALRLDAGGLRARLARWQAGGRAEWSPTTNGSWSGFG